MSRLTASPFHKPSPFVFPREPISPPETLTDSGYPTTTGLPQGLHEPRLEEPAPFANVEAHLHSRTRGPSISYHNSGFREPPNRNVHRSYRFFVVVIPPPRLIEEHGQLGHTLASGPPQRLSQGIIMPLFPTVSKLLAIRWHSLTSHIDVRPTLRYCQRVQLPKHDRTLPLPSL